MKYPLIAWHAAWWALYWVLAKLLAVPAAAGCLDPFRFAVLAGMDHRERLEELWGRR